MSLESLSSLVRKVPHEAESTPAGEKEEVVRIWVAATE